MSKPYSGFRRFTIVWLGQFVSLIGTTMSGLALGIWAWQTTQQATTLALISFFLLLPSLLISPIAGVFVDRLNRKLVLALSDVGAVIASCITLALYLTNSLEVWHLFILSAWASLFSAFQFPALSVVISTTLAKSQFSRASGMLSLAQSGAAIIAPVLAGLLLNVIGVKGILIIDILTFFVAISTIVFVTIPARLSSDKMLTRKASFWREVGFGFGYVLGRRPLRHLLVLFTFVSAIGTLGMVMLTPLVLARTSGDESAIGGVLSASGIGGVVGGLLLSAWGGPKRKIYGVLIGIIAMCLFGYVTLGVSQALTFWMIGAFSVTCFVPLVMSSNQAIWQAHVPPEIQGKVLAVRQFIGKIATPLIIILLGPLADHFFEPAMASQGLLSVMFAGIVGNEPGAGIALMFFLTGLLGVFIGLVSYSIPSVRNVEQNLLEQDEPMTVESSSPQKVGI
jgi:MFS transporter, DHA3 family, macrolide efflux protein